MKNTWTSGKIVLLSVVFMLIFTGISRAGVSPFFAPAEPEGSFQVKLHPTEGVKGPTLVTFGIPFTRGSVTETDLTKVRILDENGSEIPAYVEGLTPWRHLNDETADGMFIRVARVQFEYDVSVRYPEYETITVEWGKQTRGKTVNNLKDPRSAWHIVTEGGFNAEDNVYEPDVYAVLPPEILSRGVFKVGRLQPLAEEVSEEKDNPGVMDAREHYPGYLEYDHSLKNFFYTIINEVDPEVSEANMCHYRTEYEPWLYDRASAMFSYYFKSGHFRPLREAVRNTQFYKNHLYTPGDTKKGTKKILGIFDLKVPDPGSNPGGNGAMYSYNESLAYNYWLTGDEKVLDYIKWTNAAHEINDEPTRWDLNLPAWTERHTAWRLLSNVIAYEVFGEYEFTSDGRTWNVKNNILNQTEDFIWHQNGAGGQFPEDSVDGALYHYGRQHGDGEYSVLVASPWMSVLTIDAMVRAYAVTEDRDIANFIKRMGRWEAEVLNYDDNHMYDQYPEDLWYPAYMIRWDGDPDYEDGGSGAEIEHSLEVAAAIAWGGYFAELLGASDPIYYERAAGLYESYDNGVNYWTRPNGPDYGKSAFRVQPWRKYGWEYRPSTSLSWLMNEIKD